ncbi:MAG TPA: hypothetical protein VLQ68_00940 [Rhizobiaceae bacterium]|nr:hypothetical protein [Rhizobiaceae bacterium]
MQASEGVQAGRSMLHTRPVRPEPLVTPKGEATALDQRSRDVLMDDAGETQDFDHSSKPEDRI